MKLAPTILMHEGKSKKWLWSKVRTVFEGHRRAATFGGRGSSLKAYNLKTIYFFEKFSVKGVLKIRFYIDLCKQKQIFSQKLS